MESVGLAALLKPLWHLTLRRPELAERLVATAPAALRTFPTLEAGRCLTDHPDLVHPAVELLASNRAECRRNSRKGGATGCASRR
ncbi:hypothetical protein B0I31_117126 [Saccharothrix carnea]|uniref:Uncharacterized protein n=1 Tax=Saccharothrix carnea TaxID=1280637 RepID=A0A2P8I0E7_SACCR|nr:hypothetical protein B0I31_117126 [Saccharothrix carnea]